MKDKCSKTHSILDEYNTFLVKIGQLDLLSPQPLALLYGHQPSALCPQPSGSASIYESSGTKHVAWFIFSLLLWRQLFWNKLDGWNILCQFSVQFCVANIISFSYNKELLIRKIELRAREIFVNKIKCPVDSYNNQNP